ncbi:hypothetical protein IWW48_003758 [Coemansia sp. RSA 1200]|nr:hypothetical protein IWW48_003758 [Coemansia sp. RSA 1200]
MYTLAALLNSPNIQKKKQPLFVKDGDDIVIQKSSSNPADGIRTSVYKHFTSKMRVVVCRTSSPIYNLNIYVPTVAPNNKGLPHTLEHLVFCGSKRHPTRGFIDVLAAYNYSIGTNAWTTDDYTCYTLDAAAEDAVANVLPAFLDHVLNPLLLDDYFVTEVYHCDEAGKEQGVVFSEMGSTENSESSLGSYHLQKLVYNPSATYANYSIGKTRDIATLTNKEIIDYHYKYYDANNITVVLTGAFSDDFEKKYLQTIPSDIVKSYGCNSRAPMDCSPPSDGSPRHETVRFPSSDTSSGSFRFGWQGPKHGDVETRIALEIMMEYLAGTSSSPLKLRFVERPSPLASSLRTKVDDYIVSMLSISLIGVPYTGHDGISANGDAMGDQDIPRLYEEDYFKNLLLNELDQIYKTRFNGDAHALENAAKRRSDEIALAFEKDPDEALQDTLRSDIVASHFSPESQGKFRIGLRAKQFDIAVKLSKMPVEYWLDLLKKWLIDGTVYSVAMVPDLELGPKLEAERKKIERANVAKIFNMEAYTKHIKKTVEANNACVSDDMKKNMPLPDPTKPSVLPHTQSLVVLDKAIGPVTAVQTINADSGFVEAKIQIPIGDIPKELRAYLVLFQDVLLDTDLVLPAGVVYDNDKEALKNEKRVQYSEFASKMADLVTSRNSCVGQGVEPFLCKGLDSIFVVGFSAPYKNYMLALRWTVQGILFSEFTPERILTCAQNLLTSIASKKRSADSILLTVESHFTDVLPGNEQLSNKRHMSFLAQEAVLTNIIKDAKSGKVDEIIVKLKDIQNILVRATGGFMALSLPSRENSKLYIDALENEWKMCYDQYAKGNNDNDGLAPSVDANAVNKLPFPIAYNSRFPDMKPPLLIHVPVDSLQSSASLFSMKLDDIPFYPTGKRSFNEELADLISLDYFALKMLASLMARIDGPLDNAVRSKGYSYGASAFITEWPKVFSLWIYQASDIVKAIGAINRLFVDMLKDWGSYVSDHDINLARSVAKYQSVTDQSTPKKVLVQSISNSINGFSSTEQYNTWCNTHIAAVKMSDLRRVFKKYMLNFVDPNWPMLRLVVTTLDTEVPARLGSYEKKTLKEISATYKTDY